MNQQLNASIKSLDLSGVIGKLQEKEKFDTERAVKAVKMYREFLQMMQTNPSEALVPNEDVDAAWHHHILDTEAYVKDCQALFGQYLHHNPYFYGTPAFDVSCDRTKQLYKETFGGESFLAGKKNNLQASACSGMLRETVTLDLAPAACSGMFREPVKMDLAPAACSGMFREPVEIELAPAACSGMLYEPGKQNLRPSACSGMFHEPTSSQLMRQ